MFQRLVKRFYDPKWKIRTQFFISNQKIGSKLSAFFVTAVCLHFNFSRIVREPFNIQKCYAWLWIPFFLLNMIDTYHFLDIFWFEELISKNVICLIFWGKRATPVFLGFRGSDTHTKWPVAFQIDMKWYQVVSFDFQKNIPPKLSHW